MKGSIASLEVFMIHMAKTAEVVFEPSTTASNFEKLLKPGDDITAVAISKADVISQEATNRR